ncbi:MAG: hypothetical protein LN408_03345 [Candidatus Thermoplasmatota archaeon]|nr:hypothetical protein [Candidatus Thermoplasmatota archaeon]
MEQYFDKSEIVYKKYLGSTNIRYCDTCGNVKVSMIEDCECGGISEGKGKIGTWTVEGYRI